jgi:hypothetical protein
MGNWIRQWKGGLLRRGKILPLMEDKECPHGDAEEADTVVPSERIAEVSNGENREYREGDDFLDGLKLRAGKFVGAKTIGRDLEAVFKEGDAPTGEDDLPQGRTAVFEVTVPGEGHKNVGYGEKDDGAQGYSSDWNC